MELEIKDVVVQRLKRLAGQRLSSELPAYVMDGSADTYGDGYSDGQVELARDVLKSVGIIAY